MCSGKRERSGYRELGPIRPLLPETEYTESMPGLVAQNEDGQDTRCAERQFFLSELPRTRRPG